MARHGQTEDNIAGRLTGWGDPPLTMLGRAQAARLGDYLAVHCKLQGIYASPLARALETATIVAEKVGLVPVSVENLKEIHFGECEGLTEAEFHSRYPELVKAARIAEDMDFGWPGGENRRTFYGRVRSAFEGITRLNSGRTVLVVGHGGVLAYYLAELLEGKPDRWRQYLPDNCALAEVAIEDTGIRVVHHNYTAHLDEVC
jgi:broad specificity phosphatase PhoE